MDTLRFDTLTKRLATEPGSRHRFLGGLLGGALGGAFSLLGPGAAD